MIDVTKELEEEELEETKPRLKLITGGKEPPNSTGNWLRDLEPGTVFFVQEKKDFNNPFLESFRLLNKEGPNDKVVALQSLKQKEPLYVDPSRWCNRFNLHHTLGVLLTKEEEELIDKTIEEEHKDTIC